MKRYRAYRETLLLVTSRLLANWLGDVLNGTHHTGRVFSHLVMRVSRGKVQPNDRALIRVEATRQLVESPMSRVHFVHHCLAT